MCCVGTLGGYRIAFPDSGRTRGNGSSTSGRTTLTFFSILIQKCESGTAVKETVIF